MGQAGSTDNASILLSGDALFRISARILMFLTKACIYTYFPVSPEKCPGSTSVYVTTTSILVHYNSLFRRHFAIWPEILTTSMHKASIHIEIYAWKVSD